MAEGNAVLLGRYQHREHLQGLAEGPVMTDQERDLALRIRAQQVLGQGMFLEDEEFVQWAMDSYGLSRDRLTQICKEVL